MTQITCDIDTSPKMHPLYEGILTQKDKIIRIFLNVTLPSLNNISPRDEVLMDIPKSSIHKNSLEVEDEIIPTFSNPFSSHDDPINKQVIDLVNDDILHIQKPKVVVQKIQISNKLVVTVKGYHQKGPQNFKKPMITVKGYNQPS